VYGPYSSCASASPEKLMMLIVRPWKLPSATMILARPFGHALDPVAPLAGELERGLDALGAGVHRQDHVLAGQLGQLGAQRAELVVVERAAGQRDPLQLLDRRGDDVGVAVAEVQRRVAGEAVEVAASVHVGDPGTLGLGDHDGQRVVGVRAVVVLEVERAVDLRGSLSRHPVISS
jgi:hypothetical protein